MASIATIISPGPGGYRRHRVLRPIKYFVIFLAIATLSTWIMTSQRWVYHFGEQYILGVAAGRIDGILLSGHPEAVKYHRQEIFDQFKITDPRAITRPKLEWKTLRHRGFLSGRPYPEQPFNEFLAIDLPKYDKETRTIYGGVPKAGKCTIRSLLCPLWLPTLLLLICSTLLIWRDWPYPRGHCRMCNFNLESNTSGICPECGTPLTRKQRLLFGLDIPTIRLGLHRRHRAS